MNDTYKYKTSSLYNLIMGNILLIYFTVYLFSVALAFFSPKVSTTRVFVIFGILSLFILILWMYLRRSCQSIFIDLNKRTISFKMYRSKSTAKYGFDEIDKIYLNNWLVISVNAQKIYFAGRVSVDLITYLSKIRVVEWKFFAKYTFDRCLKKTIEKALIDDQSYNKANAADAKSRAAD